uniref:MULE transposase domain-containing protein n=1 Tax=Aegilops tauschii subsp. strangulata TaxID=200361 RepID=A0A453AWJ2_AEGTS
PTVALLRRSRPWRRRRNPTPPTLPPPLSAPTPPPPTRCVLLAALRLEEAEGSGSHGEEASEAAQEPIQIPAYYGHREEFYCVKGDDLVDCSYISPRVKDCAHVIETQDLAIKGFIKQRKTDLFDEFEPDWYMEYCPWDTHYFQTDKCWSAFANKLKRKRNVTQKFMLYAECSEIKHYGILLKAIHDDYSQLTRVVLPGTKCLTTSNFRFLRLVEDLSMTPKEIIAYLAEHYDEQMSPPEAWRARQKALEQEFGTFYDSHNFAPRLLKDITCKTPWGFVDIKDAEVAGCSNFRVLHRIFWAFGQCVQAFNHCRPVLCIKGTPLCGKYQEVLLTAVALDANGYSIPVACAVVEGETKESWMWFLGNLEQAVRHPSDVCIIHDYKRELIDAIEDFLKATK